MKILVLTDLHGGSVDSLLDIGGIDLVFVLGDITTGKGLYETKARINPLRDAYPKLYVIPGNWEMPDSCNWLATEGLSLDGRSIDLGNLLCYGIGGSITTPFSTPNEFREEEFPLKLSGCPESREDERLILLSHTPPYKACDRTALGMHVGSKNLRNFIEERSPVLVLCGHIHEARGKSMIGSSIIANPGPAPKHYALVDIGRDIVVQLF